MNHPERNQQRTGTIMIYLACVLVLGLLTLLFSDLLDRRENPNRNITSNSDSGSREVVLRRNYSGHYVAPGTINGKSVRFLLDTGATNVSVPAGVAEQIGLKPGRQQWVSTANGTVPVYATVLKEVALGNIAMRNVSAHINPNTQSDTVLLGMSFMKYLEIIQRDGKLTLRQ